jgi:hypothetical protein
MENKKTEEVSFPLKKEYKGNLDLRGTEIDDLGSLEIVRGDLYLRGLKKLTNTGRLKNVEGFLDLRETEIDDLGLLENVGKGLCLYKTGLEKLTNIGKLKRVKLCLDLKEDGVMYRLLEMRKGYFYVSHREDYILPNF